MKICIITPDYPDKKRSVYTFVKQLVDEWAMQGHHCYVIAPYSITHNKNITKYKEQVFCDGGGSVTILRPNILTFSTLKIGGFEPSKWLTRKTVSRVLKSIVKEIDCIYCHFWISGIMCYEVAKINNIPLFVATGESIIPEWVSDSKYNDFHSYVSGVICVSSKNRDESIAKKLTVLEKCKVIPNAVNHNLFRTMDKLICRKKLGLPKNVFIIIFVGWFNERKGVRRIIDALNLLNDKTIYSIFIGSGPDEPKCNNILFKGKISHETIPLYLNASDVFVLPTLHEGCSNAVIEAMSCGLPIISSNLPFNKDVLNFKNSILIDPQNIEEIANAIILLKNDNNKRKELVKGAKESAKELGIHTRAKLIMEFISKQI